MPADAPEPVEAQPYHKVTFTFENLASGQVLETTFLKAGALDFDLQAETGEIQLSSDDDGRNPVAAIHVKALNLTFKLRGEPVDGEFYTTRVIDPGREPSGG